MFGLSKKEKLTTSIGEFLHYNIRQALLKNEQVAGIKSGDVFTSSYIYSFIEKAAEISGFNGEKYRDEKIKWICNGVLPNRLYDSILKNSAKIEVIQANDPNSTEEFSRLFHEGIKWGSNDASVCATSNDYVLKLSLYEYLIKEELDKDGSLDSEQENESESPLLQAYGFLSLIWKSWQYKGSANESHRVDYLLFRYGFVDGLSQRLSLSEEKFLELLTVFDSMHAGFDQSEEEAEEISEIISKSEKSNTYPDLVMIGGKSAIVFDKGREIDELISDIMTEVGSVIGSKINSPTESQSRVKSIDTQIPSDYREYNEVENFQKLLIFGPKLSDDSMKYDPHLSKIYAEVGDYIEKGKLFAEVETDKVILEVVSEYSGIVKDFILSVGDSITDSQPIASILVRKEEATIEPQNNELTNSSDSIEERLIAIKELLEKGLITEDQANQKRESLLEEL